MFFVLIFSVKLKKLFIIKPLALILCFFIFIHSPKIKQIIAKVNCAVKCSITSNYTTHLFVMFKSYVPRSYIDI